MEVLGWMGCWMLDMLASRLVSIPHTIYYREQGGLRGAGFEIRRPFPCLGSMNVSIKQS